MLIAGNVFGPWGFHLPRIAIAPYLWQNKITKIDYLFPMAPPVLPQSERLRFIADNFHVGEVISSLPFDRTIHGVRIRSELAGEALVDYRGWFFAFSDGGVRVYREAQKIDEQHSGFLIITNERKMRSKGAAVIRISQTGALKLSIDNKGGITIRSFLKKNLPL